ncbi:head-tail adaptor protein [Pedobacter nyackensis]|uniref:phage head completion protein n=1 Tax=Pedobacter nyackensis TaxID=475255 RepID=UPI00292E2698|nr:head-tail adaptor protein [Pedobacter nyackensis]
MKNAKKYSQLIQFWKENNVSNGQGGSYGSYELDFEDYACVVTKDETKTNQQGQIVLEGLFEIYLRYRSDMSILKSHQIKLKDKSLTIHSIINVDELNKEIKLIASESDNNIEVFKNENPYENYQ